MKYETTINTLSQANELSYYLLGAFITDGNVFHDTSRTNTFKSNLSSKDKDWLELINQKLNNEGKIRFNKSNNCYTLWFHNRTIYDWLVAHDCVPRKSLIVQMPNIPKQYLRCFIRGCIDGDGTICRSNYKASTNGKMYEQITVSLISASKSFIDSMSQTLNELGFVHSFITIKPTSRKINDRIITSKQDMFRIQISGHKKCVKFLSWLYEQDCISMPRKQKIASDIIQKYNKYL